MARAMVLVSVGKSIVFCLYPKWAPKKTNGIETVHHMMAMRRTINHGTCTDDDDDDEKIY